MKKILYTFFLTACSVTLPAQIGEFELTPPGAYASGNAVPGWTIESAPNGATGAACNGTVNWTAGSPEFSIVVTPVIGNPALSPFSIDNLILGNSPVGGNNIARLHNRTGSGLVTRMRSTFTVTNPIIQYAFCGSWDGSAHLCCDQPALKVNIYDCSGNPVACTSLTMIPSGVSCLNGINGFSVTNSISWTNWQVRYIDLTALVGSCATIEVINNDCNAADSHHGSVFFDANLFSSLLVCSCFSPGAIQAAYCTGSNQAQLFGPPGYNTYQWYGPPNVALSPFIGGNTPTVTIANPVPGSIYTLQVLSFNGCLTSQTIALQSSSVSITGLGSFSSCVGGTTGSATVQANGSGTGYSYAWYGPQSPNIIGNTSSIGSLAPGIYTVNVSANNSPGCGVASATVAIGLKAFTFYGVVKSFCGTQAYLTAPSPGSNFQWYNAAGAISANQGGTAGSYTVSAAITGASYWLSYQSLQGCKDSIQFLLNQMPAGQSAVISSSLSCPGGSNGAAVLSVTSTVPNQATLSGITVYSMPALTVYSTIANPAAANLYTLSGLAPGSYSVSVFDGNCLFGSSFTVLQVYGSFSMSPVSATICPGSSMVASANFTPALPAGYSYTWSPTTFLFNNLANLQSTIITPSTVPLGTSSTIIYTIVATPTLMNCPVTRTMAITMVNPLTPSITLGTSVFCANSPAYTITASPAGGTFSTPFANGLVHQTTGVMNPSLGNIGSNLVYYSLMPGGCVPPASASFTVNAVPQVSISTGSAGICYGQSATLTAAGADSYLWNSGATGAQIVVTPSASSAYTVSGTNTLTGCYNLQTASVTVKSLPVISLQGNTVICLGESVTLTAGGAAYFNWNNTGTTGSPNYTVTPLSTGLHSVTGTGSNGCSATRTISISVNICTGLQDMDSGNEDITLSPNPASGFVTIGTAHPSAIRICNLLGEVVLETSVSASESVLDLHSFPNGLYLVKIAYGNKETVIRLIKTD